MTNSTTTTTPLNLRDFLGLGPRPEYKVFEVKDDPLLTFKSDPLYTVLCNTLENDYDTVFGENRIEEKTGTYNDQGNEIVNVTNIRHPYWPKMLELDIDDEPTLEPVQKQAEEIREYYNTHLAVKRSTSQLLTDWEKAVTEVLKSNQTYQLKASLLPVAVSLKTFYAEMIKMDQRAEGTALHTTRATDYFNMRANIKAFAHDEKRPGSHNRQKEFIMFKDDRNRLYDLCIDKSVINKHYYKMLSSDFTPVKVRGKIKHNYASGYNYMVVSDITVDK